MCKADVPLVRRREPGDQIHPRGGGACCQRERADIDREIIGRARSAGGAARSALRGPSRRKRRHARALLARSLARPLCTFVPRRSTRTCARRRERLLPLHAAALERAVKAAAAHRREDR
eukprot:5661082-Prymnesium_polylepis.1